MKIRTLRDGDHENLLEMLDAWPMLDGWRGRDFFRRYLHDDATFENRNVWVAEQEGVVAGQAGRVAACVQIFPRRLRVAGVELSLGGIGTVFTRDEARGQGVASALLEQAAADMRHRGMVLSLLFATRIPFYTRRGWHSWVVHRSLLRRGPEPGSAEAAAAPGVDVEPFTPARDLEAVRKLHSSHARRCNGVVVRDAAAWESSLKIAGNPREEFLVARRGGVLHAYARAAVLGGLLVVTEVGRSHEGAEALAGILLRMLTPRADDPLATGSKSLDRLRAVAVVPPTADAELDAALGQRGVEATPVEDPTAMLRVLDAPSLARCLGVEPETDAHRLLQRVLPPDRFFFWPADRF